MSYTLHGPGGQVKAYSTKRTPAQQAESDKLRSEGWGLSSYTAPAKSVNPSPAVTPPTTTTQPPTNTPIPPTNQPAGTTGYGRYLTPEEAKSGKYKGSVVTIPGSGIRFKTPADEQKATTQVPAETAPTNNASAGTTSSGYGRYLTPDEAKSGKYAGKTVTIPGSGIRFKTPADSPQQEIEQINQDANTEQDKELSLIESEAGGKVDLSTSAQLTQKLVGLLDEENKRQETTPSLTQKFAEERTKLGIDPLESSLSTLDADLETLDNNYTTTTQQEETRQVGMGAVRQRQDAVTQEYNRQRRDLVAERNSVANQVNQKYGVLNTMMTLIGQDIDNARADYQTKFNSAISMINLVKGIEQDQKDEAEKKADNARANLTIMQNTIQKGNIAYADLPESTKLDIKGMELAAGLPVGITSFIKETITEPIIHWGSEFTDASGNRIQPVTTIDAKGNMTTKNINVGKAKPEAGHEPPSSYQEWSLAGGKEGTGKTYAEFLATKSSDVSEEQKANADFKNDLVNPKNLGISENIATKGEENDKVRAAKGEKYVTRETLINKLVAKWGSSFDRESIRKAVYEAYP